MRRREFIPFLLAFRPALRLYSQQASGSVTGTVSDATGAAVPNAKVLIKDEHTGSVRETVTNANGLYNFAGLTPGTYTVLVESAGFARAERTGVSVDVGQAARTDVLLGVGHESPVQVTAAGPRLTGRDYLVSDEDRGYGLYSYLLFGSRPTPAAQDRYIQTLRAYLSLEEIKDLQRHRTPAGLNITYLPVTKWPDPNPSAEAILAIYDYSRAKDLLARATGEILLGGPYIISTSKPLSQLSAKPDQCLYQNLSAVDPNLVTLWIDEFQKQAGQVQFWKPPLVPHFALMLRSQVAALAVSIHITDQSAKEFQKTLAPLLTSRK